MTPIDLLGYKVKDRITGFCGVATSVSFDLYGCIQALVTPEYVDGKQIDSRWFDITRLQKTSLSRVMEVPDFAGGQDLPIQ